MKVRQTAPQSEVERKRLARVGLGVDYVAVKDPEEKDEKDGVKVYTGYC
jgi:hypothetical protein